jgi:transcriptional regulator with XRE-family HTH domain
MIAIKTIINTFRIERHITVTELANRCLCTSDMIYKIEKGTFEPSKRLLKLIFLELGLDDKIDEYIQYLDDKRWE